MLHWKGLQASSWVWSIWLTHCSLKGKVMDETDNWIDGTSCISNNGYYNWEKSSISICLNKLSKYSWSHFAWSVMSYPQSWHNKEVFKVHRNGFLIYGFWTMVWNHGSKPFWKMVCFFSPLLLQEPSCDSLSRRELPFHLMLRASIFTSITVCSCSVFMKITWILGWLSLLDGNLLEGRYYITSSFFLLPLCLRHK